MGRAPRALVAAGIAIALASVVAAAVPLWRLVPVGSWVRLLAARTLASLGHLQTDDTCWVGMAVELRRKDPVRDAREAIARGDQRLVGVAGFTVVVPGCPNEGRREDWSARPKVILGAGDGGSEFTFLYQAASCDYALAYNRTILKHRAATYE